MQANGIEEALDHAEVPAVPHAMQVEQFQRLVKSLGQDVFFLALGHVADEAAGVTDQLGTNVVDGDTKPSSHRTLVTDTEAERGHELGGDAALCEIRMRAVEREPKA